MPLISTEPFAVPTPLSVPLAADRNGAGSGERTAAGKRQDSLVYLRRAGVMVRAAERERAAAGEDKSAGPAWTTAGEVRDRAVVGQRRRPATLIVPARLPALHGDRAARGQRE